MSNETPAAPATAPQQPPGLDRIRDLAQSVLQEDHPRSIKALAHLIFWTAVRCLARFQEIGKFQMKAKANVDALETRLTELEKAHQELVVGLENAQGALPPGEEAEPGGVVEAGPSEGASAAPGPDGSAEADSAEATVEVPDAPPPGTPAPAPTAVAPAPLNGAPLNGAPPVPIGAARLLTAGNKRDRRRARQADK